MMIDRLSIAVELTIGGTAHAIAGGAVRAVSLALTAYGASGTIELVVQDDSSAGGQYEDALLADFVKPDLATVTVSIAPSHTDASTATELPKVETGGVVIERSVCEKVYGSGATQKVLFRRYRVTFEDPARALWGQHHPCDLFVQKSLQDAITAHTGDAITMAYDWDVLSTQRPHVFFDLDPSRGASFYDFVAWITRYYEGVFTFDHTARTYELSKTKDASGTAATLPRDDVERMESVFPPIERAQTRVVNAVAVSPGNRPVENANAATGMYRDLVVRLPIAQDVDDRVTLEGSRVLAPPREIALTFARFPTVQVAPGSLVDISSKGAFSADLIASTDPWRVFRLDLDLHAVDDGPEENYGEDATGFHATVTARLEAKSALTQRLPSFTPPRYPGFIEGTVVSEVGEDTDITYQVYQDGATNADIYKVKIPLFDNQIIVAPYGANQGSGTFYVPAYKGERVLVALDLHRAEIASLLDWRTNARVPLDTQGQHLFLGKSTKSNTSVLHDYESDKPVFKIARTNDKDTALVRIQEGSMLLQVMESAE